MNNNVHLFSDNNDESNDSVMNEIYGNNELPYVSSNNESKIAGDNWIAKITGRNVSIENEVKEEYQPQYYADTDSSVYVKFDATFDNSKRGEEENLVHRTIYFDPQSIDWVTPITTGKGDNQKTMTNLERVENGSNPVDYDGNPFNYHHIDQNVQNTVLMSHATHKSQYAILHGAEQPLPKEDRESYDRVERKKYNHIIHDLMTKSPELREIYRQQTGEEYTDAHDFAKLPIPEIEVEKQLAKEPSLWQNFKQRVVEEEKRQKAEMVDDIVEEMGCVPVIIFIIGIASSIPLAGITLVFFLIH